MLNSPLSTCIDASTEVCEKFLCYFIDKISTIRASISPPSFDPSIDLTCTAVFQQFEPVSLSSLSDIVAQLKPSSCPTDPVPPRLFKEGWDTIGPNVHNSSLESGSVQAVVAPLIKKTNLDTSVLSNYRPISKLPFISKILEKPYSYSCSLLYMHTIFSIFFNPVLKRFTVLSLPF